jgi:hypothetical protein
MMNIAANVARLICWDVTIVSEISRRKLSADPAEPQVYWCGAVDIAAETNARVGCSLYFRSATVRANTRFTSDTDVVQISGCWVDCSLHHEGCGGRAGGPELLTGIEGVSSRPVRRIVLIGG